MKKVIVCACLLSGCASMQHIDASVNALAARDGSANKPYVYILTPGLPGVTAGDLQFQEFSGYVERVLNARGMHRTTDPRAAELIVVMSYGIGDPQTFTQQVALPIWGQTGIASTSTTGQITGNNFNSTTTVTPSYGVTGFSNITTSHTFFVRNLRLTAFPRKEIEQSTFNQVWMVSVASAGPTADLRMVFPYLVAAAAPYVGANPGRIVPVRLRLSDDYVATLIGK